MSRADLLPTTFDGALAKLVEECGEVLQVVGKIGRHGVRAVDHKTRIEYDNGADLVREMIDVEEAIALVRFYFSGERS